MAIYSSTVQSPSRSTPLVGDFLSWLNDYDVTDLDLLNRDFDLLSTSQDLRHLYAELEYLALVLIFVTRLNICRCLDHFKAYPANGFREGG